MKILRPSLTTHTINMRPRFKPTSQLIMRVTNEYTEVYKDLLPTYTVVNGVMTLTFDLIALESDRFAIKLIQSNVLIMDSDSNYLLTDGKSNNIEDEDGNVLATDVVQQVIYRCKLFFTEQTSQNYKITKNDFIYA